MYQSITVSKMCRYLPLFQKYVGIYHFLGTQVGELEFSMVLEFMELEFFEKIASKFVRKFFMELEYHKKISKFFHETRVSWKTRVLQTEVPKK